MHFNPEILKYISPDRILDEMKKLHPGMMVTHDKYHSLVPGLLHDLEWNFFDEIHRNFVHDTYHDMYKVMAGKYFSVNVVRWGKLPIFIQVANAKIADGVFYQSMVVLGVIFLHQIVRLKPREDKVSMEIDWYIASHWLFRLFHRPFNKRLMKLQKKQDQEDNEIIRERRLALRKKGFSFLTDNPDFINSNQLANHVKIPLQKPIQIYLKNYLAGQIHRIDIENIEFMLKIQSNNEVEIWPAICPHEGALLNTSHICESVAICPWHGRRFGSVILNNQEKNQWQFLNLKVEYKGDYLEIMPI